MCNFGVFCKYQIKFPVPSPGSRRTGTPQPTSRAEEEAEQRCRRRPGTAASPDQPGAAAQTWASTNSAANRPLRPAALRRRRLLAAGSSLCQALSRGGARRQPSPGTGSGSAGQTAGRGLQPRAGCALLPAPAANSYRLRAKCRWCSTGTWKGFPGQPENNLQNQKLPQRTETCNLLASVRVTSK